LWFGYRLSFLAKSVEVERHCLSHVKFYFFSCPARRNTSWKIWGIGRKPVFGGSITIKYFIEESRKTLESERPNTGKPFPMFIGRRGTAGTSTVKTHGDSPRGTAHYRLRK